MHLDASMQYGRHDINRAIDIKRDTYRGYKLLPPCLIHAEINVPLPELSYEGQANLPSIAALVCAIKKGTGYFLGRGTDLCQESRGV